MSCLIGFVTFLISFEEIKIDVSYYVINFIVKLIVIVCMKLKKLQ